MTAWLYMSSTSNAAARQRKAAIVPPPPRCIVRPQVAAVPKAAQPKKMAGRDTAWHRIRIATTGSMRHIQDWLDDHCEGRWHVGVTGVDKYLATKFAEVHFEQATDKQRFKAMFAPRQAWAA